MKILLAVILSLFFGMIQSFGQSSVSIVDFSMDAKNVDLERGDKVLIKWNVIGVDSVFILGLGPVANKGEQNYIVSDSRFFYLIAETKDTLISESIKLEVKGIKNLTPFPEKQDYEHNFYKKFKISYDGIGPLLDSITEILENQTFATKEEFFRKKNTGIIQTNFRLYTKLKQPKDTHIKHRRISYLVTVSPLSAFQYELKFKISLEYQRKAEKRWVKDVNETHYSKALKHIEKFVKSKLIQE